MLFSFTTLTVLVLSVIITLGQDNAGEQFSFHTDRKEIIDSPVLDDEFAAWLEETGNARGMKGVAIAVIRRNKDLDGWTTETKGFGVADRWGTPVDDETLFAIGSNSKLFTALGVGFLTANESIPIDWDTKIKDILPNTLWALQDPVAQDHADLVDILSHRTGLPRHDLSYSQTDTPASAISKLRYLRPSAEFRQTYQYNNQMYYLAAYIISHLTGIPFETYITQNIISPLGMNSTTYHITEAEKFGTVADGFVDTGMSKIMENGDQKSRFKPIPFWNKKGGEEVIAGAGGVISNAKDMATWLRALILSERSPETNATVIPASVLEKVTNGVSIPRPKGPEPEISPIVYGMGQGRYTYQGHEFIEHNGETIGHYSVVTRSAHDDLGVAILTNSMADPGFLEIVKWRLLERSLGLQHVDWNKRYPTGEKMIQQGDITPIFPRRSNGTASTLPHHELAGVYFNPAYGTLTLCPYPPPKEFIPLRKECEGAITEAIEPLLNHSPPALLAALPKLWITHLLLYHSSGDKFDAQTAITFPAPFPDAPKGDDDGRPFALPVDLGSAEFVFANRAGEEMMQVEGMAARGLWGAGDGVKQPKGEGREGAEVWFDKVA